MLIEKHSLTEYQLIFEDDTKIIIESNYLHALQNFFINDKAIDEMKKKDFKSFLNKLYIYGNKLVFVPNKYETVQYTMNEDFLHSIYDKIQNIKKFLSKRNH